MAFTDLDVNWLEFPKIASYQQGVVSTTSITLDASGEYIAWCGPVQKAGTITQIGVSLRTVSVSGDLDFRLETLNSSGEPSGTLFDTNTDTTVSVSSADDYTVVWATLTNGATVSVNGWVAAKIRANSASTPTILHSSLAVWQAGTPYLVYNTGAATKSLTNPQIFLKYSDGDVVRTPLPLHFRESTTMTASVDNAKVAGNKFRLPFDATVKGFWLSGKFQSDAIVKLYDSDGSTVLQSQNMYSAVVRSDGDSYPRWMIFDSDVELKGETWYRVGITGGAWLPKDTLELQGIPSGYTGLTNSWWIDPDDPYAACYHTEASSGTPTGEGDWTDTTSQVCYMGVIITDISELITATPGIFFSRGGWG